MTSTKKSKPNAARPEPRLQTVSYIVRRPFKYDGKHFRAGDEFLPLGFDTDPKIIERLCYVKTEEVKQ